MIPENILREAGASIKNFNKKEIVFKEGNKLHHYYQIISGKIKLSTLNRDGKEIILNIFGETQSFGEILLFQEVESPFNAIALSDCKLLKLSKRSFLGLIKEYPEISMKINNQFANRLLNKIKFSQHIISIHPDERITALFDFIKNSETLHKKTEEDIITLTRQQIADYTGLTVETVIRTIKNMEQKKMVMLKNHKIFYP